MLKIFLFVSFAFIAAVSYGQIAGQLKGTWKLQYSLQASGDKCKLPDEKETLTFSGDSSCSWKTGTQIVQGKWTITNKRLLLTGKVAVNFEATIADSDYPVELKDGFLIIHLPQGGDISCPVLYFKRSK